ncbi:hypothetical protein DXG01_011120 [Tephrocybe rancida]|nr:hypothetical protein DXG01_011120 [Tephrocybe rancida]
MATETPSTDTPVEQRVHGEERTSASEVVLLSVPKLSAPVSNVEIVSPKRDLRFWLVFVALCSCTLLSAIDLAGVSTAAPTIVHALQGKDFSWVFSAYALSSSSCIPLSGNLAQIFGRRPVIQVGIVVFAAGSAVAGAAPTMTILIVGRAIQGMGGGIIQSLTAIITSDLVPLRERGLFTGITGLFNVDSGFSDRALYSRRIVGKSQLAVALLYAYRHLRNINLPLCGLSLFVVTLFLKLKTPTETFRSKFFKIDWIGNAIIIASACSCMIALTWGGVEYPWVSFRVLVPLILGVAGLAFALIYEARWAVQPTIPLIVLSNRTSISGYIATFISGMVTINIGYYLPTWFQAIQDASPVVSGLHFLPWAVSISSFAIAGGLIVNKVGRYRAVTMLGWCIMLIGVGLLINLKLKTSIGLLVLYQLIMGAAGGFLYTSAFAVLAPLPVSQNAAAVALLTFSRVFSQAWGVAIGGVVLQNALKSRLPAVLVNQFPESADIAYSIVPDILAMPEPLKHDVQAGFLSSFRVLWIATEIMCAVGAITVALMKDLPLRKTVDKDWGLEKKPPGAEAAAEAAADPSLQTKADTKS